MNYGENTNARRYWGKGFYIKGTRVFHPYTRIGFKCTDVNGKEIKK